MRHTSYSNVRIVMIVLAFTFVLGVLTAYSQGWLPFNLAPLANSSGSWSLVAFAAALFVRDPRLAALSGAVSLAALLAGYIAASEIRGYAAGWTLILFWGFAAIFIGPFLGLGAYWLRSGHPALAALGAGGMSGVLVGEGIYGLTVVARTTGTVYWWGEVVVGGVLLIASIMFVIRELRPAILCVGVCAVVATAFRFLYFLLG